MGVYYFCLKRYSTGYYLWGTNSSNLQFETVKINTVRVGNANNVNNVSLNGTSFKANSNETATINTNGNERLRITNAGNVGIGTTQATEKLHIKDGSILIDDVDIKRIQLHSLRQQIGIVFDEPFLFSTSISENISYGKPDASEAEIVEAARKAQALGFITDLESGFSTVVGERGYTLSGGQRQRIALARCLLEKPSVLILDDATSAIDVGVESLIHESLKTSLEETTTLLIAQRVSTIALADRIVFLEGGAISDEGSHSSLLSRNAAYAAIIAESNPETVKEIN